VRETERERDRERETERERERRSRKRRKRRRKECNVHELTNSEKDTKLCMCLTDLKNSRKAFEPKSLIQLPVALAHSISKQHSNVLEV
jgi:hypothetical protein